MRDEEQREVELRTQIGDEVEHLSLDGHVERRDGLVGDDEARVGDDRARNPDSLTLSAGELVRVAVEVGRLESDALQHTLHPCPLIAASRGGARGAAPR